MKQAVAMAANLLPEPARLAAGRTMKRSEPDRNGPDPNDTHHLPLDHFAFRNRTGSHQVTGAKAPMNLVREYPGFICVMADAAVQDLGA